MVHSFDQFIQLLIQVRTSVLSYKPIFVKGFNKRSVRFERLMKRNSNFSRFVLLGNPNVKWKVYNWKLFLFEATCFTKKIYDNEDFSGDFPCARFNCTGPKCLHSLRCDEVRVGFPFNLTAPLGEGGFATVFRGEFHGGEAAFKFIPIVKEGYEYEDTSVGICEYDQKEKINKITRFIYLDTFC